MITTRNISKTARLFILAGLAACAIGLFGGTHIATPDPGQLRTMRGEKGWPFYLGSPGNSHYSLLGQINTQNVAQLKEVWRFDSKEEGGLETTPLEIDGVLYAYTPRQEVIALNAVTGKLLWTFEGQKEFASGKVTSRAERALAYWQEGTEKRLFAGIANYVYALDLANGKVIPSFGDKGRIDLREKLRGDPKLQSVTITSPGVIYRDLIILGDATGCTRTGATGRPIRCSMKGRAGPPHAGPCTPPIATRGGAGRVAP